jgi:hypothetical protein
MTRFPDWPARLDAFVTRNKDERFRYGRMDCCLFVCDAIEIMTGIDPAIDFRGTYGSRAEALQAMRRHTGSSSVRKVVEHVTARHGMGKVPVLRLQRGDIALIKRPRDYSLGIVALNGREVLVRAAKGIESVSLLSPLLCQGYHV